ncbi:MAG: hypothetical protein JWM76_391 [Pseudonocardiales bacterium]|nr:hypothetical protein [Pseudonocardiales bacterium]
MPSRSEVGPAQTSAVRVGLHARPSGQCRMLCRRATENTQWIVLCLSPYDRSASGRDCAWSSGVADHDTSKSARNPDAGAPMPLLAVARRRRTQPIRVRPLTLGRRRRRSSSRRRSVRAWLVSGRSTPIMTRIKANAEAHDAREPRKLLSSSGSVIAPRPRGSRKRQQASNGRLISSPASGASACVLRDRPCQRRVRGRRGDHVPDDKPGPGDHDQVRRCLNQR